MLRFDLGLNATGLPPGVGPGIAVTMGKHKARSQSCTEATMPEPRRASRRIAGILAGVVVITALGLGVKFGFFGSRRPGSGPSGAGAAAVN